MTYPSRPLALLLLALLFLTSCLPALPGLSPAPTPTLPPTATSTPPRPSTETPSLTASPTSTLTPLPRPARVLLLSIDGFRPDAIELAPMPNLQALMQSSAYSLTAQTIFPSSTLPAHSSMLTGLCPQKHGVDWNNYLPERGYAHGTDIFDLAQAAGLYTLMVVGKEKLRQVTEPESIDSFIYINDRDKVVAQKVVELIPHGFDLLFVHFPLPDGMGHEYGWLSPEQLSVLYRADEAILSILQALETAGFRDTTLIIITADHGGHNTTHGSNLPQDMTIPWIAVGPGIHPGQLTTAINTTDTAATIAWALGLPLPPEWDGLPVLEAFGLPDQPHPQPRCRE
ncbi:MAG: alkaline phosphatase [Anaerolineales bacterium]